jgi:hypothetical protein
MQDKDAQQINRALIKMCVQIVHQKLGDFTANLLITGNQVMVTLRNAAYSITHSDLLSADCLKLKSTAIRSFGL